MLKKLRKNLNLARFHTTLKLHQKAHRFNWYKRWHDFEYSHHLHVAVLAIYVISILASSFIFPGSTFATLSAASITTTSEAEFSTGGDSGTEVVNVSGGEVQLSDMSELSNNGNGAWSKKRKISIENNSGGDLSNYRYEINHDENYEAGNWNLNGVATDSSGNGNDGSVVGTVGWVAGQYGNSASFDGAGTDRIEVTDDPSLDIAGDEISISTWVYPSETCSKAVCTDGTGDVGGMVMAKDLSYQISMVDDTSILDRVIMKAAVETEVGGGWSSAGSVTLTTDAWTHITFVYSNNQWKFYKNKVLSETIAPGGAQTGNIVPSNTPLAIGNRYSAAAWNQTFFGRVDELRVYNYALSQSEIDAAYANNPITSSTAQIVPDMNSDGSDIRFTDTDKQTELDYYLESFESGAREFTAWVEIPFIANGATKDIYIYYDNDNATTSSDINTGMSSYTPTYTIDTEEVTQNFTGSHSSADTGTNAYDTIWNGGWGNTAFEANVNIPDANTSIDFYMRSGNGPDYDNISWNSWQQLGTIDDSGGTGDKAFTVTSGSMPDEIDLPREQDHYLQVRSTLNSTDALDTPLLYDYTINYLEDLTAPTNPDTVWAWFDDTKANVINADGWYKETTPYFEFDGAIDGVDESGVKGYYVYFGTDDTADPYTAGTWTNTDSITMPELDPLDTGKTFYLRVETEDHAGNIQHMENGVYIFSYKLDLDAPSTPTYMERTPIGWTSNNNFTFSWPDIGESGGATDEDNPTGNSGINTCPGDPNNGGYEYKRDNGTDDWSFTKNTTINNALTEAYQNGVNVFQIRTRDCAGNVAAEILETNYYFSVNAPAEPENLSVTPNSNTENAFTFEWSPPASYNEGLKGYRWSVNVLPSADNSVFVDSPVPIPDPASRIDTGVIAAATQQGLNRFYVVAVDTSDNVNYNNYATVEFDCSSEAPGPPLGPIASDISNREQENWAIAVSWNAPTEGGAVDQYVIMRSINQVDWTQTGTATTTTFAESGLDNETIYYYKIFAVDNAGAMSAPSEIVNEQPTGRFIVPPTIVSGPEIQATATEAVVTWATERPTSGFVEYSLDDSFQYSNGSMTNETDHTVEISGLAPSSTYNIRVQSLDENRDYDASEAYSSVYQFTTSAAPGISKVEVTDIGLDSAIVSWYTTSSASSTIKYGKSTSYGLSVSGLSGSQVTRHTIRLPNLDHSSTYNFKISGTDIDGNYMESDNYVFNTLVYPRVFNVRFEQQVNMVTSTLKVTWDSNVPLSSVVDVREVSGAGAREVASSKLKSKHEIIVSGLRDNTEYYMIVKGRDAYGNMANSDQNRVKTDFDTRPPSISEITTETEVTGFGIDAKGQLVVSWETDEPATSQVEYGIGAGGESYSSKTQEDMSYTTSHVVIISELKTSAPYHFRIISKDESGNIGYSEDHATLTGQATESVLDVIIKSLESTIGWLFNM